MGCTHIYKKMQSERTLNSLVPMLNLPDNVFETLRHRCRFDNTYMFAKIENLLKSDDTTSKVWRIICQKRGLEVNMSIKETPFFRVKFLDMNEVICVIPNCVAFLQFQIYLTNVVNMIDTQVGDWQTDSRFRPFLMGWFQGITSDWRKRRVSYTLDNLTMSVKYLN